VTRRGWLALSAGLLANGAARADGSWEAVRRAGKLRAGLTPEGSPLASRTRTGAPDGLAVAVAEMLAHGLGVGLELVVAGPHGGRLAELEGGQYDILMTAPPIGLAAASRMMFTDAFAAVRVVLVAPRERPLSTLRDLEGLRVATRVDLPFRPLPDGLRRIRFTTVAAQDAAAARSCLARGECEAAAVPEDVARQLVGADPRLEEKLPLGIDWFGAALRYGDHDLHRAVTQVLRIAAAEGVLQVLHRAYMGQALPDWRPTF
jgi:ABC-type amino acid transport substrate-binding protein